MSIPGVLRELLEAVGPSGHEQAPAAVWRRAAEPFAEVEVDSLGTSYARVAGGGGPLLAVVAHIDEIGFQVTLVDEDGYLSFSTLGGFSAEALAGQRVLIAGGGGLVQGVVGRRALGGGRREERPRTEHADLHIDIGAAGAEEAAALVAPGDAGVWLAPPLELRNRRISSRALDNRLGAYVALEAARRVAEAGDAACELVAVASVQEEIGHHGARTAAFGLDPDVALAIDVTWTTDVPGGDPRRAGRVELGAGAAITRGPVVNPRVCDLLFAAAEAEGIAHCVEVHSGATHTDADAVHVARGGVPTGLVSVPLRYMHTPSELASLDDVEAAVALVTAFARGLGPETSFLR